MSPTRRQVLKWGAGLGALAGAGFAGGALLLPPRPSGRLDSLLDLASRLFEAIDDDLRAETCFDYEHPLRQYHNRGVDTGGSWAFRLGREARSVLVDLVHAGLSDAGRTRIPDQFFVKLPGVHVTRLAIFGDPRHPPYQILVTGPHLNLRLGGRCREGVAFGGPQVYGDQRGDGDVGLPGNVYRYQLELGQRIFESLTSAEREVARRPRAPVQTDIAYRGRSASFDGIPLADLSLESRRRARAAVTGILDTYAEPDAAYAWECLDRNGGLDGLYLADYAEDHQPGRNVGDGPSQIFRLEGPAAVFHYRGEPHLHAFLNVGMDAEQPLSVGEIVGENPGELNRDGVKALFEEVLLATTGADLAYYHAESVAGRLRAGVIRTGDLYNLESWREHVTVVEVAGRDLAEPLRLAMRARGDAIRPQSTYRIATTSFVVDQLADGVVGAISAEHTGPMLRDAAIAYLTENGFSARG